MTTDEANAIIELVDTGIQEALERVGRWYFGEDTEEINRDKQIAEENLLELAAASEQSGD